MRTRVAAVLALALLAASVALVRPATPAQAADGIWFPVQKAGDVHYTDDYGDPRGDHAHTANDIMAPQMNEVYAAQSGTIYAYEGDCHEGEYCSSYYLLLSGDDGRSYFYVHLNNDTPGRPDGCDGRGGVEHAFAPRLVDEYEARGTLEGVRVERGEHIAYNGSSGNAGCGNDHTHFEIWTDHGWGAPKIDPYQDLQAAEAAGRFWGPDGVAPDPVPTDRVAGEDRIGTAVALARSAFETADAAVIAPAEVYPEALVASPLAASLAGPVLLTWDAQTDAHDVLDDRVVDELARLQVSQVVIVGAPDRLGPELEQQLGEKAGLEPDAITRIGGADRYELARNVADEVLARRGTPDGETVSPLLALGEHEVADRGWPDALSASVLAAREQVPIVLTRPGELPTASAELLARDEVGEVRIVGGPDAIAPSVETSVQEDLGKPTRRLAGQTRYETSQVVAGAYVDAEGVNLDRLFVATGRNFPDALASGPALARLDRVLVLADGLDPYGESSTYAWLRDHADAVAQVTAVGGPVAITDQVLERLGRYANWPRPQPETTG